MINLVVTIDRPLYRQLTEVLVPKDKVTEFITNLLEGIDWSINDSITIKPTDMEYFDGRPEL